MKCGYKHHKRTDLWEKNPRFDRGHILKMIETHRKRTSKPVRAIIKNVDVVEFASIADAQRWLIAEELVNRDNPYSVRIVDVAKGRRMRCAGFGWRYVQKKENMPPVRILKENWRERWWKWRVACPKTGLYNRSDRRKYLEKGTCKGSKIYAIVRT